MIEVIDLTSLDSNTIDDVVNANYASVSSLPFRSMLTNTTSQRRPITRHQSNKRVRESTLYTLSKHRQLKKLRQATRSSDTFLWGELRPVQLGGQARLKDITLGQVLQKEILEEAVLCSFAWDATWLMEELGLASTKMTWVSDKRQSTGLSESRKWPLLTTLHPTTPRKNGSVHGKLMLLFRNDGFLRIAIPTGNLRRKEWGDGHEHTLDNAVFLIDLPLLSPQDDVELQSDIEFRSSLLEYLACLELSPATRAKVHQYNFDNTRPVGFVYTG